MPQSLDEGTRSYPETSSGQALGRSQRLRVSQVEKSAEVIVVTGNEPLKKSGRTHKVTKDWTLNSLITINLMAFVMGDRFPRRANGFMRKGKVQSVKRASVLFGEPPCTACPELDSGRTVRTVVWEVHWRSYSVSRLLDWTKSRFGGIANAKIRKKLKFCIFAISFLIIKIQKPYWKPIDNSSLGFSPTSASNWVLRTVWRLFIIDSVSFIFHLYLLMYRILFLLSKKVL